MPGLRGSLRVSPATAAAACSVRRSPAVLFTLDQIASWTSAGRDVQRDVGSGERFANRARCLGVGGDPGEVIWRNALRRSADRQLDAADPEAAGGIRAEGHIRAHLERRVAAAGRAEQRGELHGEARRMCRGNQLLWARYTARVIGSPPGEVDFVRADA